MVLWIAPWAGVYLASIWAARNSYDTAGLHNFGGGPYWYRSGWNVQGAIAFALGVVCAYLFTNATLLRGPLVGAIRALTSRLFGLAVSFCLYLALTARSSAVRVPARRRRPLTSPCRGQPWTRPRIRRVGQLRLYPPHR